MYGKYKLHASTLVRAAGANLTPKLWIVKTYNHLKQHQFLRFIYASQNIFSVYLIERCNGKNGVFSYLHVNRFGKPPVYGAVLCTLGGLGEYLTQGFLALAKWEVEASTMAGVPPSFLLVTLGVKYDS